MLNLNHRGADSAPAGTMSFRTIARAALLVAVSLGLALLLGEGIIRLVAPQVTLFPRYVTSSEYAIELPPNALIEHARGRHWRFTYTTNHLGRRGPGLPAGHGAGVPGVVALGDSFTFGIGVADHEVYTEVLGQELGPGYRVVNGGVPGWGIDSQAKWFHHVGRSYNPQVVVLQFTRNDPSDSVTGVASVQDGALRFRPYATVKPFWQRVLSESTLVQHSHLYLLLRTVLAPNPVLAAESPDRAAPTEEHYIALLEAFAREVTALGGALLFVSVTHRNAGSGEYVYDLDTFPRIRDSVRRLEATGELRFVSLPMEAMRTQAVSPEGHQWGSGHHRVVAAELANQIRSLRSGS
jgi:hypothetical protein